MFIVGLAMFGFGYAVFYYGANILVDAYVRTNTMNPVPFAVLLGIPGAGAIAGQTGAAQQGQGGIPQNLPASLAGGAGA
jgi:hypothetical protein